MFTPAIFFKFETFSMQTQEVISNKMPIKLFFFFKKIFDEKDEKISGPFLHVLHSTPSGIYYSLRYQQMRFTMVHFNLKNT